MRSSVGPARKPLPVIAFGSKESTQYLAVLPTPTIELGRPASVSAAGEDRMHVDTGDSIRQMIETPAGPVWLEGNTLFCGCPECGAPMSIRLFLLAADCWQCETSIMLSAEQQAAVERLLESSPAPAVAPQPVPLATPKAEPNGQPRQGAARKSEPAPRPAERPRPAPGRPQNAAESMTRARIREIYARQSASAWLGRVLRMTPAWLISFVIHFVGLLLLALFLVPNDEENNQITLSTMVRSDAEQGGDLKAVDEEMPEFDLPTPPKADVSDRDVRAALAKADQDARALRLDDSPRGVLPDLNSVKQRLSKETGENYKFAARDPRMRVDMIQNEGGTLLTEAAVARGLRWLAAHQNQDGSWSLNRYANCKDPNNPGDAAATALALLPFLGAGQTHEYGIYKDTVAKGLKWMLDHQRENGDLRDNLVNSQHGMYAHGQGSIVLVEALAMTGDERFREPAQKSIDFICAAQNEKDGGWRYAPGQAGDTSVFGWQMMALQSASSPDLGLTVPEETLKLADYYLDLAQAKGGSRYNYQPGGGEGTFTMTAEGLLCRMYLGWHREDPRLVGGVDWLIKDFMPTKGAKNIYYWYYATQTLHHFGGPRWEKWNAEMRDILVDLQEETGDNAGSWSPAGFQWQAGERVYVTSLAICTLEVYYRHLPLFKQLEIGK